MAFRLDAGVGGGTSTPAPTIANVRQVDAQQAASNQWSNVFAPSGIMAEFTPQQQPAPMSYNVLPVSYAGARPQQQGGGGDERPEFSPGWVMGPGYPMPSAQQARPGWNIGGMPAGYEYRNGFPVPAQEQPQPVRFNEQGKDKGMAANNVINKSMAQAALEQYGRGSATYNPYWGALYNAYGGGMLPDTFNPLAQATFDYYRMGIPGRSSTMLPDTYQNMALRWLQQNTTGRQLPDTFNFQQDRLAEQLTALLGRQTSTTPAGGGGYSPVRYRYYGGGGGRSSGYSSGGYSPSWFNGLLSWRI